MTRDRDSIFYRMWPKSFIFKCCKFQTCRTSGSVSAHPWEALGVGEAGQSIATSWRRLCFCNVSLWPCASCFLNKVSVTLIMPANPSFKHIFEPFLIESGHNLLCCPRHVPKRIKFPSQWYSVGLYQWLPWRRQMTFVLKFYFGRLPYSPIHFKLFMPVEY